MVFREFVQCHKGHMLIKVISCEKPFLDKKTPLAQTPTINKTILETQKSVFQMKPWQDGVLDESCGLFA